MHSLGQSGAREPPPLPPRTGINWGLGFSYLLLVIFVSVLNLLAQMARRLARDVVGRKVYDGEVIGGDKDVEGG